MLKGRYVCLTANRQTNDTSHSSIRPSLMPDMYDYLSVSGRRYGNGKSIQKKGTQIGGTKVHQDLHTVVV